MTRSIFRSFLLVPEECDQVNLHPTCLRSSSLAWLRHSPNSSKTGIQGVELPSLSCGSLIALKSPATIQGKSHEESRIRSAQSGLRCTKVCSPYTTENRQDSCRFRNLSCIWIICPEVYSKFISNKIGSHPNHIRPRGEKS